MTAAVRSHSSRSRSWATTGGQSGKDPHALDIYFLGYGSNYKKALSDYTQIAGKIPLPPSYVFGYWYSKYSSYSADDYREIMNDLSSNNIPTDVMILDMDWHWNGSEEVCPEVEETGQDGRGTQI